MKTKDFLFLGIFTLLAIGTLIFGLSKIGNPFAQAEKKVDQTRVVHLSKLKYQIEDYVRKNGTLPQTIEAIPQPSYKDAQFSKTDPETKQSYTYKPLDTTSYEVCATFTTDTKTSETLPVTKDYNYDNIAADYKHPKGYYCFKKTVDAYIFPTPTYLPAPGNPGPTGTVQIFNVQLATTPTPSPSVQ